MLSLNEYLASPCRALSIPYWKHKRISVPEDMRIVHKDDFDPAMLAEYSDEPFFRLMWKPCDKHTIFSAATEGYKITTAGPGDFESILSVINASYSNISMTADGLKSLTRTPVYCPELWLLAVEGTAGHAVACGIADFDREVKELILEWIQVLPEHRSKGIAQALVTELLRRGSDAADFATVSGSYLNETQPEKLYRRCGFEGSDVWHILRKK